MASVVPVPPPPPLGPSMGLLVSAGSKGSRTFSQPITRIVLSDRGFRLAWGCAVLVHVSAAMATCINAAIHLFILHEPSTSSMLPYIDAHALDFFPAVIVSNLTVAGLHVLALVYIFCASVYHRELVLDAPAARAAFTASVASLLVSRHKRITALASRVPRMSTLHRTLQRLVVQPIRASLVYRRVLGPAFRLLWAGFLAVFGRHGLLGIESRHAEALQVTRELVELGMQTYQAHSLSCLVAKVWINEMFVVTLALNAWATPASHWIAARHRLPPLTRRVCVLTVDTLIDFLFCFVLPFCVFYPTLVAFDTSSKIFPTLNYYTDTWYVTMLSEHRQLFAKSTADFLSRAGPALTMLSSLRTIEKSVTRRRGRPRRRIRPSRPPTASSAKNEPTAPPPPPPTSKAPWYSRFTPERRDSLASWSVNAGLVVWGFAVLGLHLHAALVATEGSVPGCLLEMRPWGTRAYTCVVLELSCAQRGITGHADEMAVALDAVGGVARIESLIISHCPALAMPPSFQSLQRLQMLKIHNSSIVHWGLDAALTQRAHPIMQVIFITNTNMPDGGQLPIGLYAPDFPEQVYDIEFCGTNLATLPASLTEAWAAVVYVAIEKSPRLTEVPEVLGQLREMDWLSLAGNGLRAIPDRLFENKSFVALFVMDNPLERLPASLGDVTGLARVGLGHTRIDDLALLLDSMAGTVESAHKEASNSDVIPWATLEATDTPFCRRLGVPMTTIGPVTVRCDLWGFTNFYPLANEIEWRHTSLH